MASIQGIMQHSSRSLLDMSLGYRKEQSGQQLVRAADQSQDMQVFDGEERRMEELDNNEEPEKTMVYRHFSPSPSHFSPRTFLPQY